MPLRSTLGGVVRSIHGAIGHVVYSRVDPCGQPWGAWCGQPWGAWCGQPWGVWLLGGCGYLGGVALGGCCAVKLVSCGGWRIGGCGGRFVAIIRVDSSANVGNLW